MFNEALTSIAATIIPQLSNDIAAKFALSMPYAIAIQKIISEVSHYVIPRLTESSAILIAGGAAAIVVLYFALAALGVTARIFGTTTGNSLLLTGKETPTGEMDYSVEMQAVNDLLINKYRLKHVRKLKYDITVADDVKGFKLGDRITITISRAGDAVTYRLDSFTENLEKFVSDAKLAYMPYDKCVVLVGTETENGMTYQYSEEMMCLTYVLIATHGETLQLIYSENKRFASPTQQANPDTKPDEFGKSAESAPVVENSTQPYTTLFKNMCTIGCCKLQLTKDVIIIISRTGQTVTYTLHSNKTDIHEAIKKCVQYCKDEWQATLIPSSKYVLTFVGAETATTYKYSDTMVMLTSVLIKQFGFTNLRQLTEHQDDKSKYDDDIEQCTVKLAPKSIYAIEACNNVNLGDTGVNITVTREQGCVKYVLRSDTRNLQDFVLGLSSQLEKVPSAKYRFAFTGNSDENIPSVINDYIKTHIGDSNIILKRGYLNLYKVDDKSIKLDNLFEQTINGITFWISLNTKERLYDYILTSDTVNIKQFVDDLLSVKKIEYDKSLQSAKPSLRHHVYIGKEDNEYKFKTYILRDQTQENNESLDTLFNEHADRFKADIDRLNDDAYYARTEFKRKKCYLLHGPPGTGKTETVRKLAMYANRHIIEISSSAIKTNADYLALNGLTNINGWVVSSSNSIIFTDEMDVGFTCTRDIPVAVTKDAQTVATENLTNLVANLAKADKKSTLVKPEGEKAGDSDPFNLACFLAVTDGVGTYNKKILIGATNCIDKFPAATFRDGRLALVKIDYLRNCDVAKFVGRHYQCTVPEAIADALPHRKISSAKMIHLLEFYENEPMERFCEILHDPVHHAQTVANV